jgi:hypothetical protein
VPGGRTRALLFAKHAPRQPPDSGSKSSRGAQAMCIGRGQDEPSRLKSVHSPTSGRDLQADDVAVSSKEILEAGVTGCDEDALRHLRNSLERASSLPVAASRHTTASVL